MEAWNQDQLLLLNELSEHDLVNVQDMGDAVSLCKLFAECHKHYDDAIGGLYLIYINHLDSCFRIAYLRVESARLTTEDILTQVEPYEPHRLAIIRNSMNRGTATTAAEIEVLYRVLDQQLKDQQIELVDYGIFDMAWSWQSFKEQEELCKPYLFAAKVG